jgi:hypothetical protein
LRSDLPLVTVMAAVSDVGLGEVSHVTRGALTDSASGIADKEEAGCSMGRGRLP